MNNAGRALGDHMHVPYQPVNVFHVNEDLRPTLETLHGSLAPLGFKLGKIWDVVTAISCLSWPCWEQKSKRWEQEEESKRWEDEMQCLQGAAKRGAAVVAKVAIIAAVTANSASEFPLLFFNLLKIFIILFTF